VGPLPLTDSGSALFAGSAREFITMAPASSLTAHLKAHFGRLYGTPGTSEVNSWRQSLTALATVADHSDLEQGGVGVELRLPSNSRRIDATFVGRNANGKPSVVLVELKQWESVNPSTIPDNVLLGGQEYLHPSVQARGYADYLRSSHSAFTEHDFHLSACAFLHNMPRAASLAIRGVEYEGALRDAPLFTLGDEDNFAEYLGNALEGGDGMMLLPALVNGRHSPSKKLIDTLAAAFNGNPLWTLVDEQRLAFNLVRGHVEQAAATGQKAVVIVVGGPGTGKSVIALNLLFALTPQYRVVQTTASKAFTTNLRAVGPEGSDSVFCWNRNFAHKVTQPNSVDVLLIDEAHRVRLTSNSRWMKRDLKSEIPQANELIRAGRVSVFFLDERQSVRPDEIGTVSDIEHAADEEGVPHVRVELKLQFRCNGSAEYVEWVDALFSDTPVAAKGWLGEEYHLRIFDSPAAVETAIRKADAGGKSARLIAGFCWAWSDPNPDGSLVRDVQIGDWARPWNEKPPEQRKPPRPAGSNQNHPYTRWATSPKGLDEVGCTYTAQGLEFDYCGVIMGNDLVWRDKIGWIANKCGSHDPSIMRSRNTPARLRTLLEQTYRVLFTRGMEGTFVYSTDHETRAFLKSLVLG